MLNARDISIAQAIATEFAYRHTAVINMDNHMTASFDDVHCSDDDVIRQRAAEPPREVFEREVEAVYSRLSVTGDSRGIIVLPGEEGEFIAGVNAHMQRIADSGLSFREEAKERIELADMGEARSYTEIARTLFSLHGARTDRSMIYSVKVIEAVLRTFYVNRACTYGTAPRGEVIAAILHLSFDQEVVRYNLLTEFLRGNEYVTQADHEDGGGLSSIDREFERNSLDTLTERFRSRR